MMWWALRPPDVGDEADPQASCSRRVVQAAFGGGVAFRVRRGDDGGLLHGALLRERHNGARPA